MNDAPYADEDDRNPLGCLLSLVLMLAAWVVIFYIIWNFA